MLLYLVNPANPLVSMTLNRGRYWNRFRLWKPLGLLVLAGLTPSDWEVTVLDENLGPVDYDALPTPDLVGITAFTSQAPRAYEIAARYEPGHPGGDGRHPRDDAGRGGEPATSTRWSPARPNRSGPRCSKTSRAGAEGPL